MTVLDISVYKCHYLNYISSIIHIIIIIYTYTQYGAHYYNN